MTYISIAFRKNGTLVIGKYNTESQEPLYLYRYNSTKNNATRFIEELRKIVDPYETEIIVINFPKGTKSPHFNQVYGAIMTLKKFGMLNKLTFNYDQKKMYKRIIYYTEAGKNRKQSLNGISQLLSDSVTCPFYDNTFEMILERQSTAIANLYKLSAIGIFYMIIKDKMQGLV